jgi:GNAT superfamily N-acetyltransferase
VASGTHPSRAPLWRRALLRVYERHASIATGITLEDLKASAPNTDDGLTLLPIDDPEPIIAKTALSSRNRADMFRVFQAEGYDLYGAFRGDALAGYTWYTDGPRHWSPFFGWIPLRPDECYCGYVHVDPSERGRGVSRRLMRHGGEQAATRGARWTYMGVLATNLSSLTSSARIGSIPAELWHYQRLGPFVRRSREVMGPEHPIIVHLREERRRSGLPPLSSPSRAPIWPFPDAPAS